MKLQVLKRRGGENWLRAVEGMKKKMIWVDEAVRAEERCDGDGRRGIQKKRKGWLELEW